MEAMVEWHREGYIDPAVWEKLIRNKVNPAVMPAPSVLQSLPSPPRGALYPVRGNQRELEYPSQASYL